MSELIEKLGKAKDAVRWLLDHESGSVDFHDLKYWAGVVEDTRAKIRESL